MRTKIRMTLGALYRYLAPRPHLQHLSALLVAFGVLAAGATMTVVMNARSAVDRLHQSASWALSESVTDQKEIAQTILAANRLKPAPGGTTCDADQLLLLRSILFRASAVRDIAPIDRARIGCTAMKGRLASVVDLGAPDIAGTRAHDYRLWFNRSMRPLGYPGITTHLVAGGGYLVVTKVNPTAPQVRDSQIATFVLDPTTWVAYPVVGDAAIVPAVRERGERLSVANGAVSYLNCPADSYLCAVVATPIRVLAARQSAATLLGLVVSLLLASVSYVLARRVADHFFSEAERIVRSMDRIFCTYQPIVQLPTQEVVGVEVLCRFRDHDGSVVGPDRFLPAIRARRLTAQLLETVVAKAIDELNTLSIHRTTPLKVGFNATPMEFSSDTIAGVMARCPRLNDNFSIGFEITEESSHNIAVTEGEIQKLRAMGYWVSLDDFGIGFSNIEHLLSLSVDTVKIDRFFAGAPHGSVPDRALPTIISMIRGVGKMIVVEGIETLEKLNELGIHEVEFAQGYLFSRPLTIDDLASYLARADHPVVLSQAA